MFPTITKTKKAKSKKSFNAIEEKDKVKKELRSLEGEIQKAETEEAKAQAQLEADENAKKVAAEVHKLYADPYIKNRKGVFEFVLGSSVDTKLLEVRVFDEAIKKSVYATQTEMAKTKSKSNCPLCAIGHDANKEKIWSLSDMDADHVAAWSKGGATSAKNCQMLCKTHNRAKGNR